MRNKFFMTAASLSVLAASMCFSESAYAAGKIVKSLNVSGNKRIEAATIRSLLVSEKDGSFSEDNLNSSLKRLYASGYFKDVQLDIRGKTLYVSVVENPNINRIGFEGNDDIEDAILKTETGMAPRQPLTRASLKRAVNKIKRIYRNKGFFVANVVPKIVKLPQNRVDVVFEIEEGDKTKVGRIFFIGNKNISSGDLEETIQTKQSRWYRFFTNDDNYDPDRMAYDRELLRLFYLSKGYADFRVKSAVAELSPDEKEFFMTFTVDEGPRYNIGAISVSSKLEGVKIADLEKAVTFSKGDIFNNKEVEKTVDAIVDAVGKRGYAFVDVFPNIKKDPKTKLIQVDFQLSEGPRVYVENITIIGNSRTDDDVIRREMLLYEGDAYNSEKMKRSERRIKNLGYFKNVTVKREPGSYPDRLNVIITVEEDKTGEVSIAGGFSTQDGILGDVKYTERNFRGRGQEVSVGFVLSKKRKEFTVGFTEPKFMDMDLAVGVELFRTRQSTFFDQSFEQRQMGGALSAGYELAPDWHHSVNYSLRQDKISGIPDAASLAVKEQAGTKILSQVSHSLSYDKRDTRVNTTTGYIVGFSNAFAGVGGDIRYLKNSIFGAYYYPVRENWILEVSARYSLMTGLGQKTRVVDRYTLGADSFPGFEVSGVGPRVSTGKKEALGGRKSFVVSAEMLFPIGLPNEFGVKGAVFGYIGSVWDSSVKPTAAVPAVVGPPAKAAVPAMGVNDSSKIRASIGVGLRWRSPFGPIKIDVAKPLRKTKYDKTQPILFGMSTRF